MPKTHKTGVRKAYSRVLIFGIISAALYAVVFTHEEIVKDLWARGGIYAVLPIGTALIFSFVHGSFANYLMTILGITPKKKLTV